MIVKLKEYVDSKQIDKLLMYLSFKKDHIQTYIDVCIKKDKITKLYRKDKFIEEMKKAPRASEISAVELYHKALDQSKVEVYSQYPLLSLDDNYIIVFPDYLDMEEKNFSIIRISVRQEPFLASFAFKYRKKMCDGLTFLRGSNIFMFGSHEETAVSMSLTMPVRPGEQPMYGRFLFDYKKYDDPLGGRCALICASNFDEHEATVRERLRALSRPTTLKGS